MYDDTGIGSSWSPSGSVILPTYIQRYGVRACTYKHQLTTYMAVQTRIPTCTRTSCKNFDVLPLCPPLAACPLPLPPQGQRNGIVEQASGSLLIFASSFRTRPSIHFSQRPRDKWHRRPKLVGLHASCFPRLRTISPSLLHAPHASYRKFDFESHLVVGC